jgi:hypothetical protein
MTDRHQFRFAVTLNMGDFENCSIDYTYASDAEEGESFEDAQERVASKTVDMVMTEAKKVRSRTNNKSRGGSSGGY